MSRVPASCLSKECDRCSANRYRRIFRINWGRPRMCNFSISTSDALADLIIIQSTTESYALCEKHSNQSIVIDMYIELLIICLDTTNHMSGRLHHLWIEAQWQARPNSSQAQSQVSHSRDRACLTKSVSVLANVNLSASFSLGHNFRELCLTFRWTSTVL